MNETSITSTTVGRADDVSILKINKASNLENISDQKTINKHETMSQTIFPVFKNTYQGKKRGRKPKIQQENSTKKQKAALPSIEAPNINMPGLSLKSVTTNGTFKTEIDPNYTNTADGTSFEQTTSNSQPLAHLYHRREFVCDRCSTLRRACFGMLSSCNSCLVANKECTLNRPRMRKSKPRQQKVMEMAVAVGDSGSVHGLQVAQPSDVQEASKYQQLESIIKELRSEVKDLKKDKKISDEYYKELEIENGYLKDTVTTLQQLFKEQQNLVQLLEMKQLQNFEKLEKLQAQPQTPAHYMNRPEMSLLNPQLQQLTNEKRDWLLQVNNAANQTPIRSTLNFLDSHQPESLITKNVSPNNSALLDHDVIQSRINHQQLQSQLEKLTNTYEGQSKKMSTTWSSETSVNINNKVASLGLKGKKGSLMQNLGGNAGWSVSQFISD
ncbi:hypothetical protein QEN19_002876 [Hanseniaspora menglaensis]